MNFIKATDEMKIGMKIKLTKYSFHFFTFLYFIHKFSLKYTYIWVELKKDKKLIR